MNHAKLYKSYLSKLVDMVNSGSLIPQVETLPFGGSAVGLEGVFDGVDVSSLIFSC